LYTHHANKLWSSLSLVNCFAIQFNFFWAWIINVWGHLGSPIETENMEGHVANCLPMSSSLNHVSLCPIQPPFHPSSPCSLVALPSQFVYAVRPCPKSTQSIYIHTCSDQSIVLSLSWRCVRRQWLIPPWNPPVTMRASHHFSPKLIFKERRTSLPKALSLF